MLELLLLGHSLPCEHLRSCPSRFLKRVQTSKCQCCFLVFAFAFLWAYRSFEGVKGEEKTESSKIYLCVFVVIVRVPTFQVIQFLPRVLVRQIPRRFLCLWVYEVRAAMFRGPVLPVWIRPGTFSSDLTQSTYENETRKLERQDLAALYGVSLFQFDSKTLSSSECGISRVSRVFYLIVPKVLDTFFGTQDRRR